MRKTLIVIALLILMTLPASAQDYWNLKTAFDGVAVFPADSNGAAFGGGIKVSFGNPDGTFDIGFEVGKWWRSFDLNDPFTGELIRAGSYTDTLDGTPVITEDSLLNRDQQALQFSIFTRYKFFSLFNDGLDLYSGVGGGFYFLQERREESRRDPSTGYWEVVKVDNYLDTKGQTFFSLGFDSHLFTKIDVYVENRFTYIYEWDKWSGDSYAYSLSLGLKYQF